MTVKSMAFCAYAVYFRGSAKFRRNMQPVSSKMKNQVKLETDYKSQI
jgi:hypothetical protein